MLFYCGIRTRGIHPFSLRIYLGCLRYSVVVKWFVILSMAVLRADVWSGQGPIIQSTGPVAVTQAPALPLVVQPALPGEGWVPGTYPLRGSATIFDTWKVNRHLVVKLPAGTPVTLISGLSQIIKPDRIVLTSPVAELGLHSGDTLLRYTYWGEGNADVWVNGWWHTGADLGWVKNADGSGCHKDCKAQEREQGQKVWWFQVRLADGRLGWSNDMDSLNHN